jgi:hypothetical protein
VNLIDAVDLQVMCTIVPGQVGQGQLTKGTTVQLFLLAYVTGSDRDLDRAREQTIRNRLRAQQRPIKARRSYTGGNLTLRHRQARIRSARALRH